MELVILASGHRELYIQQTKNPRPNEHTWNTCKNKVYIHSVNIY